MSSPFLLVCECICTPVVFLMVLDAQPDVSKCVFEKIFCLRTDVESGIIFLKFTNDEFLRKGLKMRKVLYKGEDYYSLYDLAQEKAPLYSYINGFNLLKVASGKTSKDISFWISFADVVQLIIENELPFVDTLKEAVVKAQYVNIPEDQFLGFGKFNTLEDESKKIETQQQILEDEDSEIDLSKKQKDIRGQKHGLLTAIRPIRVDKHGWAIWLCKCDCGNFHEIPCNKFYKTQSCGCLACTKLFDTFKKLVYKNDSYYCIGSIAKKFNISFSYSLIKYTFDILRVSHGNMRYRWIKQQDLTFLLDNCNWSNKEKIRKAMDEAEEIKLPEMYTFKLEKSGKAITETRIRRQFCDSKIYYAKIDIEKYLGKRCTYQFDKLSPYYKRKIRFDDRVWGWGISKNGLRKMLKDNHYENGAELAKKLKLDIPQPKQKQTKVEPGIIHKNQEHTTNMSENKLGDVNKMKSECLKLVELKDALQLALSQVEENEKALSLIEKLKSENKELKTLISDFTQRSLTLAKKIQ